MNLRKSSRATAAAFAVMLLCLALSAGLLSAGVSEQEPAPTLVPPTLVPTVEPGMMDALPSESALARIQRDGIVRIGILFNEPPFGELNIRGEVSGFDADLARAMAEAWGVQADLIQVTRQTAMDMLLSGQLDLLIATQVHRRDADSMVEFSQTYYPGEQALLVREGDGATVLGHMDGRKIGVVMGTRGERAAQEWIERTGINITIEPFLTLDHVLSALQTNAVDGVVHSRYRLARELTEAGVARFVDEPVAPEPFGIAMRRQDVNLRNLVNKTLQYLVSTDKMNEIHQANFDDAPYPADEFSVWEGLGEDAPTPGQFATDIPYPTQPVVPRLQNGEALRVAGVVDLPEDASEGAKRLDATNRAVIEALASRWGVQVEYIPDSADNAIDLVASGQADIALGVEPTWDAADRVDFTQGYLLHGDRLMVRASSTVETFGDLRSEWIGYFDSEEGVADKIQALAEEARAFVQVIAILNEEEAVFGMTAQANWDAVFGDSLKLVPHVVASPEEVRLTTEGGDGNGWYSREYLAMAVPRNDIDFRLLVDYTLQELYRDGTLNTLLQPVMLPEDIPVVDVWPGPSTYLGYRLDQVLGG